MVADWWCKAAKRGSLFEVIAMSLGDRETYVGFCEFEKGHKTGV